MPSEMALAADVFTFDSGNILNACVFYLFAGTIAGTVASYVVRGKMGCILGNFFLGIVGAIVSGFILNFVLGLFKIKEPVTANFIETTIIASISATLLALAVNQGLKAERRQQQRLLDKAHAEQEQSPPAIY